MLLDLLVHRADAELTNEAGKRSQDKESRARPPPLSVALSMEREEEEDPARPRPRTEEEDERPLAGETREGFVGRLSAAGQRSPEQQLFNFLRF